jgi:hypothetical protein
MGGISSLGPLLALYQDESRYDWFRQTVGIDIEEYADQSAERSRQDPLAHWEEEAWDLLGEL